MLWQKIYDKLSSFRNNSIFFYYSTPPVDVDNMTCEKKTSKLISHCTESLHSLSDFGRKSEMTQCV